MIGLLFWAVSALAEDNPVKNDLNELKEMIDKLRVVEYGGSGDGTGDVSEVELLFENKRCQRRGSWMSLQKEADPATVAANAKCFKVMSNDCTFTFKAIKVSTARGISFKPAPSECAIESFNMTFYSGDKQTATITDTPKKLDTSKASHFVKLSSPVQFDRLVIGAKNSPDKDSLCLCELFVKNR